MALQVQEKRVSSLLDSEFLKKLEQIRILSKKTFRGMMKGERRSKKKGISVEFADYRNYARGDDVRFIDWNIYSRLDRLFLKLFLEEEELFFYVLIDSSKSMSFGAPPKFDYAKKLGAALCYIALTNLDRVGIGIFGETIHNFYPPTRGKGHIWRLLNFLENLSPEGKTSLKESARNFALKNKTRGIVILISDLLDPTGFEEAFKWLSQGGFEIYIIHILSEDEINPTFAGHLELIDSETGEKIEVTANEALIKIYKKTLNLFCDEVKKACDKRAISYVPASTSLPFEQLILHYLKKRGLLK